MASVSAIIVTRGNVDLEPILESLPDEWEKIVWNNGKGFEPGATVKRFNAPRSCPGAPWDFIDPVSDLSVYGRYAAIEYASYECIYVQDDDCIVSDPQAIWRQWIMTRNDNWYSVNPHHREPEGFLVANMPPPFRHDGYTDSCLVGFGACFHRDLPARAFDRFIHGVPPSTEPRFSDPGTANVKLFHRTCDVVFTTLIPRVLVDVSVERLDYAFGEDRMWRQPGHVAERTQVLEMARKVRDA